MKPFFALLSGFLVIASSCPNDKFLCGSGECLPLEVICNSTIDCKDGSDEGFCGGCGFENGSCGWNDTSKTNSWKLVMANMTYRPTPDHTTESLLGHVMYLNGSNIKYPSKATLELAVASGAALACHLSFWYQFQDVKGSSWPRLRVNMLKDDTKTELLSIEEKKEGWENATAFIGNQPGGYKLEFSFDAPFLDVCDVMLDDITLKHCGEWDVPAGSDQLTCDFEKDTCSWYADNTKRLLWKINGRFGEPGYDHTTGKGHYMNIETRNNLDTSSTARLISYPQPVTKAICVSFWYHMFGNSIGSLRFITKRAGENETLVWIRQGTQGNKWRFADLTFQSQSPLQFIIEAGENHTKGSIAVDDIEVSSSTSGCPAERECTFQSSLCGLQPRAEPDFSWIRTRGIQPTNSSGPASDHTLGTEQGFYLSARLWGHPAGTTVGMLSSVMEPRVGGECWMFWYYMEGEDVGQLTVSVQTPEVPRSLGGQNWTRTGDQGGHWRHARVTVDSREAPYQLLFEATAGSGARRDVVIDDIIVLDDICPPEGYCDFEMDYCGWVNSPPANSSLDWDWLSEEDHTIGTNGHFVRISCDSRGEELIARLETESMPAVESGCLELWHHAESFLGGHT
ncbi:MAM and LDL-receptor class A domain-containing protein 1-like [Gadus chalcogrammus]|uniref:MAM and LDL-receptor class A domain-containing protein 1-like n=1 Tax=Gadus chalcogrammus TaxID=1042646 RepID=UPI0024C49358|nr:MAM and LDL-receptor class A domain-containing protein 1-like [Gadus chalcogrammus]